MSDLVARFNRDGLAALDSRHGGGHKPTYEATAQARILREAARTPTPETDGTATWSLTTLRRVLRAAPDGLPKVPTFTTWHTPTRPGTRSSGPAPGARPGRLFAPGGPVP